MTRRKFYHILYRNLTFDPDTWFLRQQKAADCLAGGFQGTEGAFPSLWCPPDSSDNIFLYNEGARWLGVPHRMGGLTKKGVDCSGFVAIVFREVYGKQLARSSADMLKHNCKKVSRANLKEGDLVFFRKYS